MRNRIEEKTILTLIVWLFFSNWIHRVDQLFQKHNMGLGPTPVCLVGLEGRQWKGGAKGLSALRRAQKQGRSIDRSVHGLSTFPRKQSIINKKYE